MRQGKSQCRTIKSRGGGSLDDSPSSKFLELTHRISLATLAVAGFVVASGAIVGNIRLSRAQDTKVVASFGSGSLQLTDSPCGVSPNQPAYDSANNILSLYGLAGSIVSNCLNITADTNSTWGYTLTIAGPNHGNLTLANVALDPISGTIASPTVFASQSTGGAWGFAIPSDQMLGVVNGFDANYDVLAPTNTTNTANYAAVPTTATPFSITTEANVAPDSYDIFFAAAAGAYMPTGSYTGVITISGVGNAKPVPGTTGSFIQDITADNCPSERTRVVDARDDRTYWVRKIPGTGAGGTELCWMETNLAYAGGGDNTYGDVKALNRGASNNPSAALYEVPIGGNPTSGTTDPSTSTNGTGQYGYLYNWCAAMGGQPDACQIDDALQPDPNISICPAGWRLPTGEAITGEFTLLNDTINGGITSNTLGLFTNGLYMYAGGFTSSTLFNQGSNGNYWSSTISTSTTVFALYFVSFNVVPSISLTKDSGYSVRCVSDPLPLGEAPAGADMQRITLAGAPGRYSCPTTRTLAVDARDDSTYWVRKIGDLCWMETNLAYAGGGDNTYGDALPAFTLGNSHTGSSDPCYGNNATMADNPTTRCYWAHADANPTSITTEPPVSSSGSPQYGYLYNWCTAMANQPEACQITTASQPNQSVNGATLYNICPSGWRLPTGEATTGELAILNGQINSGSSGSPSGLLYYGLLQRGGSWTNGAFANQGSYGYYMSSTASTNNQSFGMHFTDIMTVTGYSLSKGTGLSVRCVNS
ncbi:hypothetical protein FWG86_02145 [Candidatus Saccharibacteria bacterium]|nr:hypothetical protein [Candidatus Saccharibacteria bacterium]